MNVIIVENEDDFRALSSAAFSYDYDESLFVCSADIMHSEEARGARCIAEDDYLPPGGQNSVMSACAQLMDSWYLFDGLTKYDGHHLGILFGCEYLTFQPAVKTIMTISGLLRKEKPAEIIVPERMFGLVRDVVAVHSPGVGVISYSQSYASRTYKKLFGNPYIRYLLRPRKLSVTIREIRDYLARYPAEFSASGTLKSVPDDVDILFSVSHENNIPVAVGPFRNLCYREKKVLMFVQDLDGGAVLDRLQREGINDYIRLGDIMSRKHKGLYLKLRSEFARRLKQALSRGFLEHLDFMGVGVLKYIDLAKLRWIVTRLLPYYAVVYNTVSELISDSGTRVTISMNDIIAPGMSVALAARESGVPTFDIQHGAFGRQNHRRMTADKWFVWAPADRDFLLSLGMSKDSLIVTGNPAYDDLAQKKYDADDIRARLSIPEKFNYVVTWAPSYVHHMPQFSGNMNEDILMELAAICDEIPDIMFIVKPHPFDPLSGKGTPAGSPRNLKVLVPSFPLDELFHISSVVMTWNSTAIREAVLLDRPIIGFNPYPLDEIVPSVSEGVAVEARSIEELKRVITGLVGEDSKDLESMAMARRRYTEKYLYKPDGKASERIADEIELRVIRN